MSTAATAPIHLAASPIEPLFDAIIARDPTDRRRPDVGGTHPDRSTLAAGKPALSAPTELRPVGRRRRPAAAFASDILMYMTQVYPLIEQTVFWTVVVARAAVPIGFLFGLLHVQHGPRARLPARRGTRGCARPTSVAQRSRPRAARPIRVDRLLVALELGSSSTRDGRAIDSAVLASQDVRIVERDGEPLCALAYDPALSAEPGADRRSGSGVVARPRSVTTGVDGACPGRRGQRPAHGHGYVPARRHRGLDRITGAAGRSDTPRFSPRNGAFCDRCVGLPAVTRSTRGRMSSSPYFRRLVLLPMPPWPSSAGCGRRLGRTGSRSESADRSPLWNASTGS